MALRIRGQVALDLSHSVEAEKLLLEAARRLEPLDAGLARDTYLEALLASSNAGRFGDGVEPAAAAARAAPRVPGPPTPSDVLLDGMAVLFTEGHAAGAPILKRALTLFREADMPTSLYFGALASQLASQPNCSTTKRGTSSQLVTCRSRASWGCSGCSDHARVSRRDAHPGR